jgi:hypothetical protein
MLKEDKRLAYRTHKQITVMQQKVNIENVEAKLTKRGKRLRVSLEKNVDHVMCYLGRESQGHIHSFKLSRENIHCVYLLYLPHYQTIC